MGELKHGRTCVFNINYHIVWSTKYRRKVLTSEIETRLKEKIDAIIFSDLPIRKKRIGVRKLKRVGLEPKFVKMFINLLEYIQTV